MTVSATADRSAVLPDSFLDPGSLLDCELELVRPSSQRLEDVVRSAHPELQPWQMADSPAAQSTREKLITFLALAPDGNEVAKPLPRSVSAYHFWMLLRPRRGFFPAVPMAGMINLRLSHTLETERYFGHIGYHVFPPARGHHFAERSCRLLVPLARRHGIDPLWITCNPENTASRRTCERLGANLVEIIELPFGHPLRERGEKRKCRYCWRLADIDN